MVEVTDIGLRTTGLFGTRIFNFIVIWAQVPLWYIEDAIYYIFVWLGANWTVFSTWWNALPTETKVLPILIFALTVLVAVGSSGILI